MPYSSAAQSRYMHMKHPEIAGRWDSEMRRGKKGYARRHPIKAANLPEHVDKSIMSILRKPKVAQPILRTGVTRAGRVGVEFEHQGVKGWGPNESAARASWEQNRAMSKSDAWEVPMDHFEAALPRKRPNYRDGSGNVVGKRMSGAVTGVAKPKKVQPTRVAGRTASGAVKIPAMPKIDNSPPIPPNMVGKRDRRYNPEANRQRRLGGAAALATGAGALLAHRGVKGVREATRLARRGLPFAPTAGRPAVILEEEGKAKRVIPVPERVRVRAKDLHEHGITASRSDLRNLGAGVGLMGGGVGINHYGRSRSNREWR